MKVLWLANIPSPYRVDFFNELGKYCELTVLFEKKASSERDSSWKQYKFENFQGIILKGINIKVDTAFCPSVIKFILKREYDFIIVTNFTDCTGMLAISIMRKFGVKYWLESDGGFAKSGKGFTEKVKKHFIEKAELYLSTGTSHDEYYLKYGAVKEKIKNYPFSSIYEKDIMKRILTKEEKIKIRNELDIQEEKVVLAIGQFIHRKGFDILLKACMELDNTVGIYFIGGKPPKEYLDLVGNANIHFKKFMSKQNILKYCRASDVFVLPTREDIWGLVINEAFACGIPVVSTERCGAAIQLIQNGRNGYIVPVDDVEALQRKINEILKNDLLNLNMSCNALSTAHENTIETMVKRHMNLFKSYNEKGRDV